MPLRIAVTQHVSTLYKVVNLYFQSSAIQPNLLKFKVIIWQYTAVKKKEFKPPGLFILKISTAPSTAHGPLCPSKMTLSV